MADLKHIDGLTQLAHSLRELPSRIAKNVLRGMVGAGAAEIRNEAKTRAPMFTGDVAKGHPPPGTLKRSIYQQFIPEQSDMQHVVFYVGVRHGKRYRGQGKRGNLSQDAFYWWFVENGTVNMTKQPFLRPAFEAKKESAVYKMAEYGNQRLPDEVAKLKGGG